MNIAKFMVKNSNFEFGCCSSPQHADSTGEAGVIRTAGWVTVCTDGRRCEICFGSRGRAISNMMVFKRVLRIESCNS